MEKIVDKMWFNTKMKESIFNIASCLDDGTAVIYNTCSRKYLLQNGTVRNDETCFCRDNGMVVNNGCDEVANLVLSIREELNKGGQSLTILPTTNCNARCWYCYERGIEHCDMSQSTIDHTISFITDQFSTGQELSINWFGGEPLMHFEAIKQITEAVKSAGYTLNTCITTNGSMITPELICLLKDNYKNVTMSITIDAMGNDYGKIKSFVNIPAETAFDNLIHNIESVMAAGIRVLLRLNFKDFDDAKKLYHRLAILFSGYGSSLCYIYYAPIWNKKRGHSLEETLRFIDYLRDGYDINVLANPYIDNVFLHHVANDRKIAYCTAMNKNHYVVNADGAIYRCHCLVSDKKYSCGNVWEGVDFSALGYRMFEPNVKLEQCKTCPILPVCMVKCKVRDVLYGDDVVCGNTKTIIEPIIKLKIGQKEARRCRKPLSGG